MQNPKAAAPCKPCMRFTKMFSTHNKVSSMRDSVRSRKLLNTLEGLQGDRINWLPEQHLTVLYRLMNSQNLFLIIFKCLLMGVYSHMHRCVAGPEV